MNIIVTGTGRCGTGFMARWLSSAGIKCTHEGVFNTKGWDYALEQIRLRLANPYWGWQADSSWLAAPWLGQPELKDMTVIHVVRHPKPTIDSFLRLILYANNRPYFDWAAQFLPRLRELNPVDSMVYWYITLNEMIEPYAHYRHMVEDSTMSLERFLGIDIEPEKLYNNTLYNTRAGLGPSNIRLEDINSELRDKLLAMTDKYGYEWDDAFVPETIEATWWAGQSILLDSRSGYLGGSWQWRDTNGKPLAYDGDLVKFFYEQTLSVEHPFVVDVGASTGSFTLLPLLHPTMNVLAFEPNPMAFSVLESNIKLHNLQDRTSLCQIALSDTNGTGTLKVPEGSTHMAIGCLGSPRPRGLEWYDVPVEIKSLDSYNLPVLDFLKIDTEGNELNVLKGGEVTIKRFLPSILLEYQALNTRQFGYEPEKIIELLESWGYDHFEHVGIEDIYVSCDHNDS